VRSSAKELVACLTELLLDKGVPAFLLASNMTEANYRSIVYSRSGSSVIVEMKCADLDYPDVELEYRYTYNSSGYLVRCERITADGIVIEWDRYEKLRSIVLELKTSGGSCISNQVASIISQHASDDDKRELGVLAA